MRLNRAINQVNVLLGHGVEIEVEISNFNTGLSPGHVRSASIWTLAKDGDQRVVLPIREEAWPFFLYPLRKLQTHPTVLDQINVVGWEVDSLLVLPWRIMRMQPCDCPETERT